MVSFLKLIYSAFNRIATGIIRFFYPEYNLPLGDFDDSGKEVPHPGGNLRFIKNVLGEQLNLHFNPEQSIKLPIRLNFTNKIIFPSVNDLHKLSITNDSQCYIAIKFTYDSRYLMLGGEYACLGSKDTLVFGVLPKKPEDRLPKIKQKANLAVKMCILNGPLDSLKKFWDEVDKPENYRKHPFSLVRFKVNCEIWRDYQCCPQPYLIAALRLKKKN